ncbi:MAG: hypothetical protein LBE13_02320 [Bacteroidales bacterium]|jgi:molybdenum cofactor biosynthesis enzyme MoaA|nr:hypothetical protein [Bacteroidales bacterium]
MQYSERYKVQSWVNLVDAVPLPVPLSISIEISGLCNFKCKFCMNSMVNLARHGKGHMSMDTFDLIIDNIREMNSRAGGGGY